MTQVCTKLVFGQFLLYSTHRDTTVTMSLITITIRKLISLVLPIISVDVSEKSGAKKIAITGETVKVRPTASIKAKPSIGIIG